MEIVAGLSPAGVHRELLYSAGQVGVGLAAGAWSRAWSTGYWNGLAAGPC